MMSDVNVLGVLLYFTRAAVRRMLEEVSGHIVFVSSRSGAGCPAPRPRFTQPPSTRSGR